MGYPKPTKRFFNRKVWSFWTKWGGPTMSATSDKEASRCLKRQWWGEWKGAGWVQGVIRDWTLLSDTSLQGSRWEEIPEISKLRKGCTLANYSIYSTKGFRVGRAHRPSLWIILLSMSHQKIGWPTECGNRRQWWISERSTCGSWERGCISEWMKPWISVIGYKESDMGRKWVIWQRQ